MTFPDMVFRGQEVDAQHAAIQECRRRHAVCGTELGRSPLKYGAPFHTWHTLKNGFLVTTFPILKGVDQTPDFDIYGGEADFEPTPLHVTLQGVARGWFPRSILYGGPRGGSMKDAV